MATRVQSPRQRGKMTISDLPAERPAPNVLNIVSVGNQRAERNESSGQMRGYRNAFGPPHASSPLSSCA